MTPFPAYTSFAEIDLQKLRKNVRILIRLASPASLLAVVKANAYGHGANRIAEVLEEEGVRQFMVATLGEALALREGGLRARILVATPPHTSNFGVYRERDIHASIVSMTGVNDAMQTPAVDAPLSVHLKIDTGMGRLGMTVEEARTAIPRLLGHPSIQLTALWTHLATATLADTRFAVQQLSASRALYDEFKQDIPLFHAGNGGALLNLPDHIGLFPNEWVRAGGAILGLTPLPEAQRRAGLEPVLALKSRILQIKTVEKGATISYGREWTAPDDRRIATIGIGYGDGYPSRFDAPPEVFIHDRTYPVAGRICMDMMMVDLGPPSPANADVSVNDEVLLFGDAFPALSLLAERSGKKAYEICCNLAARVPRLYLDDR